jgi:DNA polymerase III epsilon subunit-like protein
MSYISVDVESDGEITGVHSIVCFGAVIVREGLKDTFYGQIRPIGGDFKPEALAISGFTRAEHEKFGDPVKVMSDFAQWIKEKSVNRPVLISDNNGYDAAWINYYFHKFYGSNPFGFSSRRLGDLYCGMVKDAQAPWKFLRDTTHTHNPVDDAKGNAEVLLKMQKMGLKIKLV